MKTKRVFFLQELVPNYRVPVFRRLAEIEEVDLTVFYSEPSKKNQMAGLKNASDMAGFRNIRLHLREVGSRSYQFSFLKHLLTERPDVVVSGKTGVLDTLIFLLICKFLGIRFYWFAGGVPFTDERKIKEVAELGRLYKLFGKRNPSRQLTNCADGMIVYSSHAKRYFSSLGFPEDKIWVAPNSPDTDALLKYEKDIQANPEIMDNIKRKYSANGEKIVLMLGRLNDERKTDVLLNAFKKIRRNYPEVALLLIGDGGERSALERMVKQEQISNVYFLGAMYNDRELAPYFMSCDVFVTPGVASLALKIAMTFGRPVVTVDHGLEVHAVDDKRNGFVVPIDNVDILAEKIIMLLQDDALWKVMHINARRKILDEINIGRMIDGFKDAINSSL